MPTAISLFTGCGGSDTGVHAAGFEVLMANDIIPYAKEVYLANLPETEYLLNDIKKIHTFPSADLLVGCYPCQGFSQGGNRKADSKINYLYKEFSRALQIIKPKAFIVENVSGMMRTTFSHLLKEQVRLFSEAGYNVASPQILNAADFGVAQNRKRIFIVGIRNDFGLSYNFPKPTFGIEENPKFITIRDALHGMPDWPEGEFYDTDFHWYYLSRNRKQEWDSLSKTIVSNPRHMPLHPVSPAMEKIALNEWRFTSNAPARRFSFREAARLQGFKPNLVFPESKNSTLMNKYKVIGNAVPPALFEAVAKALPDIW
ncbi:MAG: DNA cytosine methyltransferase [Formosimonas sp.]